MFMTPLELFAKSKALQDVFNTFLTEICVLADVKSIGNVRSVCEGGIKFTSEFFFPALAEGVLSPRRVCDENFGFCSSPVITQLSADEYVAKRLASKPDSIKNNDFVNNLYK